MPEANTKKSKRSGIEMWREEEGAMTAAKILFFSFLGEKSNKRVVIYIYLFFFIYLIVLYIYI